MTKRITQSGKEKAISQMLANKFYAVFLTKDLKTPRVVNLANLRFVHVDAKLQHQLRDIPHHWHYRMFTLCREQSGKQYMVLSTQAKITYKGQVNAPVAQPVIAQELHDAHIKFLSSCNTLHQVNTGWLAIPYHHSYSEDELAQLIMELTTVHDCWNYESLYEHTSK